ncbi:MAG: hypothetical protein DHS20C05_10340 [Hyphococcus sp.]|nr:MAG: hypothetical protein DHS20C05_10340 [Marinicaulis sp.]
MNRPHKQHLLTWSSPLRLSALALVALAVSGCFATSGDAPEITIKEFPAETTVSMSGWDYISNANYQGAIAAFQSELAKTPDDVNLQYGLAEAYRYTGKYDWAEKQYARLLVNDAYAARAMTGIGLVKLMSYDGNGAYEMLNSAVMADDKEWKAWLGLAQLRDSGKDWGGADEAYKKALGHTDKRALVLNNHGVSYFARGEEKLAIDYFNMALAIKPGFERALRNLDLAKAATETEIREKEYSHLDEKYRAKRYNNKGYIAMMRGNYAMADLLFDKAIEEHPSFYAKAHKNKQALQTLKSKNQ